MADEQTGFVATLKHYLGLVPTGVWIAVALFVIVIGYWKLDDIGSWWENRTQGKVDEKIAAKQAEIDNLTTEIEKERARRKEIEARDVLRETEIGQLRSLVNEAGGRIAQEAKKIEDAEKKFTDQNARIDAVSSGQIPIYDFCIEECKLSAAKGYPCRAGRCEELRGQ